MLNRLSQIKIIITGCSIATMIALLPTAAAAAPYYFTSGSVQLTAVLQGTTTSVLEPGTSPVLMDLGGSVVDFDSGTSTISDLELIPISDFVLDLDETVVGFDLLDVMGAVLVEAPGATALVDGGGFFFIDTEVSATVEGIGGPPPSTPVTSITSGASGLLGLSGDTLSIGLFGINIATFESLASPGTFIEVKADFDFVGVVPEPTTALLLGLGLAGLASSRPRRC